MPIDARMPMRGIIAAAAAMICLVMAMPAASADEAAFAKLDGTFVTAYGGAAQRERDRLRASVPVIVNLFDQIALYRPGVDEPDVFTMEGAQYREATAVSHAAAALYAQFAGYGTVRLNEAQRRWLRDFVTDVNAARDALRQRDDIPDDVKSVQQQMLAKVGLYAEGFLTHGSIGPDDWVGYSPSVRPGITRSLEFAAQAQLVQFREQLEKWRAAYPTLAWDKAVVVVISGHQPRLRDLQLQFFDWALDDRPGYENKVVYAETLSPPSGLNKERDEQKEKIREQELGKSLLLLSKVMLDKDFADAVFGSPYALQHDVLGPAAEAVIRRWPLSRLALPPASHH
jgi:hypothetical protein